MFVTTKASALRKNAEKSYQSVTFHKNVKKQTEIPRTAEEIKTRGKERKKSQVPDMKKLRYEIIKFGTSGFSGAFKEDANIALMVSLGAERPKNKGKNYKELLEEKQKKDKNDAESDEKKYKPLISSNKQKPKQNQNRNRKKDVRGLLDVYGEVKNARRGGRRKR